MSELERVRLLYGPEAVKTIVSIEPGKGDADKNHGWYPEGQAAADRLLAKVLMP